jgi:type VI secretion system protein ImpA
MLASIDLQAIIAPISGAAPAGEDLRYASVYDEIKEARRADDDSPQGAWQRDNKTSDWDKVVRIATDVLVSRSKDYQVAAWLAEALANEQGFAGVDCGLRILHSLLSDFWDTAYPLIEDDDFDYRVAPFEFLNNKMTSAIKDIPLTDPRATQGYSFTKWKESRDVGYESDGKKERRAEQISEGKLPAEEFDTAVTKSSPTYYQALAESLSACLASFSHLDAKIDQKFGSHAPRVSDIGQTLEECHRLVKKICKEQKGLKNAADLARGETEPAVGEKAGSGKVTGGGERVESGEVAVGDPSAPASGLPAGALGGLGLPGVLLPNGDEPQEIALWNQAVGLLQGGEFRDALSLLLSAASSQPSERGRSRYRYLVAKLCLKAGRPDLAKPIVEQLHTMINELHLEHWESHYWVSEILESLYQCLMSPEYVNEDPSRAQELFRRICTMDVTKALGTRV